ncbi:ABC transporter ATP-binding protein [Rhizobium sp. Leaf262]|uniref:ABC transporter ATP-binding protein n=1 Tax=Rhizobium sp. Leaf262 TaxID=1736312 RepID=UPI001FCCF560|nr:ABC transporter ATP-binding protein [Rhizobium sp. Leaf262]
MDQNRSETESGNMHGVSGANEPVLAVRDLTTAFRTENGWTEVIRKISFDIGAKETVAIVGESGSGKSVTSLSIMRLLNPDNTRISGSIKLLGRELTTLSKDEIRRVRGRDISMIFQEPMTSLNPAFTIENQLAEALLCQDPDLSQTEIEKRALALLEKVRIPSARTRLKQYPHEMSGGMRQRVMIAMALASRPKLLIADEPTTALDVTVQGQVLDLIKTLQDEEGMSVLFITHDMGVVAQMADRTVVMLRGDLVEEGATSQIFSEPRQPYTRALLAAVPVLGSMKGHDLPQPFPLIDPASGAILPAPDMPDTVQRNAPPLVEVKGLMKRFPMPSGLFRPTAFRVHAVENVSFQIQPGETLSLVGESGCGKSTTGRSVLRLTEPSGGDVRIDGAEVSGLGRYGLRRMRRTAQMIFQDPYASLNPRLSVGTAVAEPLVAHGIGNAAERRARVSELLVRVGLSPEMASRYPHEFSGGQRQRICIARALALEPKLIIADEAVSALDVSIKAQVVNLMLDLQASMGLAYLFISHDMAVVERISHRVAVMYLGEIVEIGPRAAIFGDPRHPYTRRLIDAVPVPDPSQRGRRGTAVAGELSTPVRPADFVAPQRIYDEVSPGHLVMRSEAREELAMAV